MRFVGVGASERSAGWSGRLRSRGGRGSGLGLEPMSTDLFDIVIGEQLGEPEHRPIALLIKDLGCLPVDVQLVKYEQSAPITCNEQKYGDFIGIA
ncbi:hypothetical protein QR680_008290 [Steinernema hermaphroditum]|uniref:Uncharacterized protein n=1 Tax=Steinernema hermaphroditum TaxID=289476 RepID=A0AA39M7L2_9BILA|nr:hypothetical protein QR680_008290 [Steinernema hermaphroditum]